MFVGFRGFPGVIGFGDIAFVCVLFAACLVLGWRWRGVASGRGF